MFLNPKHQFEMSKSLTIRRQPGFDLNCYAKPMVCCIFCNTKSTQSQFTLCRIAKCYTNSRNCCSDPKVFDIFLLHSKNENLTLKATQSTPTHPHKQTHTNRWQAFESYHLLESRTHLELCHAICQQNLMPYRVFLETTLMIFWMCR